MYAPMLATPFKGLDIRPYLKDARWICQQKFDGNRVMIVWRPGAQFPQFITRNGTVYTKKIPAGLMRLHRPIGNGTTTVILDGELVGDVYYVFDLLEVNFGDLSDPRPYEERRERLVSTMQPGIIVVSEADTSQDKALFVEQAIQQKCEGIVLKSLDSGYAFGRRSGFWLKVKFERTVDVIILSVREKGKESAEMVLRDDSSPNPIVSVGDVSLLGKEKRREIYAGMVVEVKYLYATENHRLYQPRIVRIRDDKLPSECTIDQLFYTDKGALVR